MRFLEKVSPLFYITVDEKRISILNVKKDICTERDLTLLPENPFAHPRVLIGDIEVAKNIVLETLKENAKVLLLRPTIIFHSLRKFESGITELKKQAVINLLVGMGARQAFVYEGNVLSREEVLEFVTQNSTKDG